MATPADRNEGTMRTRSKAGSTLSSSQITSTSVAVARAKAKAEAARVKLSFAQKEADILKKQAEQAKQKAELDADLHVLKSEKEAAATQAEAQALEEYVQEIEPPQQTQLDDMPPLDPTQRTEEYVQQQAEYYPDRLTHNTPSVPPLEEYAQEIGSPQRTQKDEMPDPPFVSLYQPVTDYTEMPMTYKAPNAYQRSEHSREEFKPLPFLLFDQEREGLVSMPQNKHDVSPKKQPASNKYDPPVKKSINDSQIYQPGPYLSTPRSPPVHPTDTSDLAKYLMRREMVSSGLLRFDDQPENYWAWKSSFQSAVWELNLTPQEELDLLAKWLGPQSAAQARRIRAAYIHDPKAGLNMVWQ